LTLERLAERCGVSKSMLSQIERGQVNPTFAVVWNLSQVLGLDLNLLGRQGEEREVIQHEHAYSSPTRRSEDGLCELRMLSPTRTVLPVEWYEMTLATGGKLVSDAHAAGTFEHFSCLTGAVEVSTAGKSVTARAGDTLRYRADRPHTLSNAHDGESKGLLLVALPGQYKAGS
jgi:transcriptional regulator with XRE-family HTH domain